MENKNFVYQITNIIEESFFCVEEYISASRLLDPCDIAALKNVFESYKEEVGGLEGYDPEDIVSEVCKKFNSFHHSVTLEVCDMPFIDSIALDF